MQAKNKEENRQNNKEKKQGSRRNTLLFALAIIVPSLCAFFALFMLLHTPGVPFSTFKSNFLSSSNVSIVAVFSNYSQFAAEEACFVELSEVLPFKNVSRVNRFLIYTANDTCTFSPVYPMQIETKPASYCLSIADSEPSIFLNYSSVNTSIITAYRLTIYGNAEYMQKCPIAVDMS